MKIVELNCHDSPTANGRQPVEADTRYTVRFPLDTGEELQVHVGKGGFDGFLEVLRQWDRDDALERLNSGRPPRL